MEDIMRTWPSAVRVVLNHGLLCVGCPFAPFQTVEDAIREHRIDGDLFRADILAAIETDEKARHKGQGASNA